MLRWILSIAFLACIPLANWMVGHVGTVCPTDGPCLVPVWPWPVIYAPSGSVLMGVALVLRNLLQQQASRTWIFLAILAGAILSAVVSPPSLVAASAASFFFSETADWAVYTPLRRRGMALAVMVAGCTGALVDSSIFVTLAFGGQIALIGGQVIAKVWSTLFAAGLIATLGVKFDRKSVK